MGLLDRLFGAKPDERKESDLQHQNHYDHHAPINLDDVGGVEESRIDLALAEQSMEADQNGMLHEGKAGEDTRADDSQFSMALTVVASDGDHIEGGDLVRECTAVGLHMGKDGLFHRYPEQGVKAPLYSVSNILNPGLFDPKQMMSLKTRGLLLFFQLPGPHSGKQCLTAMLEGASQLAAGLGAILMDAERRPLKQRTLQQMQEQLSQFEYQQELARRKAEQTLNGG